MHGRPRNAPKRDEAISAAKAAELQSLQSQVLRNHHLRIYDENALAICAKLIEINPELYTGWNYRKLAVQSLFDSLTEEASVKPVIDGELRVVESALMQNPKCYFAWHHRKWVLEKWKSLINLGREIQLLDQLLKLDARNFHGWSYRRFVAGLKNISDEDELKFTSDKIDSNFSNYSAWHNRSMLLSRMLMNKSQGVASREKMLAEELYLVHQAIFTDPDDQSGWFYHLWLLKETFTHDAPVIVGSWPRNGSTVLVSCNTVTDDIPIILYFSLPVGGVSSSTASVECVAAESQQLPWTPLSIDKSGMSRSWFCQLKIENADDLQNDLVVKICVGSGQGIISSAGADFKHPHVFEFKVNFRSNNADAGAHNFSAEIYPWAAEKLSSSDSFIQDSHSLINVNLLKKTEDCNSSMSQFCEKVLESEVKLYRELLIACDCKIGKLTLARLLMLQDENMSHGSLSSHESMHGEILEIFDALMKVDSQHNLYYKDMRSLVLLKQVISNALTQHHSDELGGDDVFKTPLCLANLSISRFGHVERLLWVRVLDLSNNGLQSIEGFEAMQLLKCLNLGHNKFRSFSALEPLRLIGSLSVLDISFNEIGSHSIDTSRYLSSSPFPLSTDTSWIPRECGTGYVGLENWWEANVTLKDLNLVQLNITGNAIDNDDTFKKFIQRILPSLKWLDGVKIQ